MIHWVRGLLASGAGFFMLWILWQFRDVFPGGFEAQMVAAIIGTALIIFIAFSGDSNRGQPSSSQIQR